MGSTAHFFIPLSRTLQLPDGFNKTKYPTGQIHTGDGTPSPTKDGAHFVFHQVATEGSPHIPMDSSFQIAAKRADKTSRNGSLSSLLNAVHVTVVEAMIDLDIVQKEALERDLDSEPDEVTAAFDYAVSELNVLLRALAMVTNDPIRLVTRESLPPMIPMATSDIEPWEMISRKDRPKLEMLSIFNLNSTIPFITSLAKNHDEIDSWLDAALVSSSNDGPFTTYLDFHREATLNHFENGNYRIAAIFYASSCEALLDELLQHSLWENNFRPEDAAKRFLSRRGTARGIVDLVKNELPKLFPNSEWGQETPKIIQAWRTDVAALRNRAIHYGYMPTRDEVRTCLETVDELVKFVADQSFEARTDRPITALALLGQNGLAKRNGWDSEFSSYEGSLSDVNVRLRVFKRWRKALAYFRVGERGESPLKTAGATCYLVISPQNKSEFFLVNQNGILAEKITRDEITLTPETESSIREFENLTLPYSVVAQILYSDLTLRTEPTWGSYVYDVLPGHEVGFSTLAAYYVNRSGR